MTDENTQEQQRSNETLDLEAKLIEVCQTRRNHMALIRMLIESMDDGSTEEAINRISDDARYNEACIGSYQGDGGKVEWAITVMSWSEQGTRYCASYFGLQIVLDVVRETLEDLDFTGAVDVTEFDYDRNEGRNLSLQEFIRKTLNGIIRAYNDGDDDYFVGDTSGQDWWIYVCFPTPSEGVKGGQNNAR